MRMCMIGLKTVTCTVSCSGEWLLGQSFGMNISDVGFEILMQQITPSIMAPAFVAQSNKYVPRQITSLCNDIKYCVDQDRMHVNAMGEDDGFNIYKGLLVRAQQAYKLTAGMEGSEYWRTDYKNGMNMLAKLIEEPYPEESVLKKEVSVEFSWVNQSLKPNPKTASQPDSQVYKEQIKKPEIEKIDSSIQFKYVQKCTNNALNHRHHVRLRLPQNAMPREQQSQFCGPNVRIYVPGPLAKPAAPCES
jgi:hypothetical protein